VTLLSLVDVPLSAQMRGTDLGPWLAGETPKRLPPVFSEMGRKKMVVHQGHKLICDTARNFCELYDLVKDPKERRNLISRRSDLAAGLRKRLRRWIASHSRPAEQEEENEVAILLGRGRQKDTGAIPGLLELCKGEVEVRREAVRLLSLMRHSSAREALVRAATDTDPGVRIQATVGSALLGEKKSVAALESILARPDLPPELRRDALLARARAGDRRATKPLCRYLASSEEIYERKEIIEALGRLGDPAAGPALRGQLATLRTKLLAIEALGLVRDRQVVPTLVQSLRRDRFISWRRAAARALGYIGDPQARPALQEAVLRDLEPDVVAEAMTSLARLRALPVPGMLALRSGPWTCADGTCRLDLGQVCTEDGHGRELLLLLRVSKKRRFLSDLQHSKGAKGSSEPAAQWRVLCGELEVGRVQPGARDAAVLPLKAGAPGPLRLESKGATLPPLVYAGLRTTPGSDR
jgi:HEAT repeat protein